MDKADIYSDSWLMDYVRKCGYENVEDMPYFVHNDLSDPWLAEYIYEYLHTGTMWDCYQGTRFYEDCSMLEFVNKYKKLEFLKWLGEKFPIVCQLEVPAGLI